MLSFLEKSAKYVFAKHSLTELSQLCVVLPTRRAVFYFKQYLAALSDQPFLSPDVLAIDDFVMQTTRIRPIDNVALLFELFDVFKEIDPKIDFDRFVTWAPTLLQDFDKIDQYLTHDTAKALFEWISDAKAIERWNIETGGIRPESVADKYFKLFENIRQVYGLLQQRLDEKQLTYRGMAYKVLSRNVYKYLIENAPYQKYYFVGFNALSDSEETIFRELMKKEGRAEALWDTDNYYMDNLRMEAGKLLRRYRDDAYMGGKKWSDWQENHLLGTAKNIHIVGVSNTSMQTKIAGHLYDQWLESDNQNGSTPSTAIVLGDETMLTPMLHSLSPSVTDFNVTMGVSLKNSLLFTLIDTLFELQRNTIEFRNKEGETVKIPKYHHKHIAKVLNHPFIRKAMENQAPQPATAAAPKEEQTTTTPPGGLLLAKIQEQGLIFLSEKEIKEMGEGNKLIDLLFSRWNNEPRRAIATMFKLINALREVYREMDDAIELEHLYLFYTVLTRLQDLLKNRPDKVPFRSFKMFLYDFLKREKIPFSGEPISRLQIMGMLETRTLDFERLIILSVNEGTLPQGKKNNSLIPFDAAINFGLPTHGEMDAVMAYHFFRLLQRAKEVYILYVEPSDTYGAGEKSRFIWQIEHELATQNPQIKLHYPQITFKGKDNTELEDNDALAIAKTDSIVRHICQQLSEKGLYPSHLNQYIKCSLQYYFSQVANVSEAEEEMDEKLGTDQFGNWIHNTLERIDKDFSSAKDRFITQDNIKTILSELPQRLTNGFNEIYRGMRLEEGINYILYEVALKYLQDFFNHQLAHESFPLEVLDVERKLSCTMQIDNGFSIKVAGRIDRIDRHHDTLRVIDYKTGQVTNKDIEIKTETIEENLLNKTDWDKIRQLWLYKYIIAKQLSEGVLKLRGQRLSMTDTDLETGFYSFRNIKAGFLKQDFAFAPNESPSDFITTSEQYLRSFVATLLDKNIPFEKTSELKTCEYCNYKRICGR